MIRNIRLLYIHNFLTDFCPHWPYAVIYFAQISGSYTVAMAAMAVETISAALMDIPTGIFSDRAGRRVTIALGSLCSAAGIGCYAAAHGVTLLYIGAFFCGLGQCLFSGNNNALLYESLKTEGIEDRFHHYRGGTGSMFQLALCLSAFGAMFLSHYGMRFIFIAAVVPQVLAVLVSLLFDEPRFHIADKQKSFAVFKQACIHILRNPKLLLLVMGKAVNYGAGEAKFKFQIAYMNMLWPTWAMGLYRGFNHALGFVGFRFAGRVVERFKVAYIFVTRDVYWFISQMVGLFIGNDITPLLFMTEALPFGPGMVASDHLMQIEFTDAQRATMGSLASSATSLVFAAAALAIGAMADRFGPAAGVGFGVCLGAISLPIYIWLFRKDF